MSGKGFVTVSISRDLHDRISEYLLDAQYRRRKRMTIRQLVEEALEDYLVKRRPVIEKSPDMYPGADP